jgi:hypothetical protein
MSPVNRALIVALLTFVIGGTLNLLAVRLHWMPRFFWSAAIVTPLAVGLFSYLMSR